MKSRAIVLCLLLVVLASHAHLVQAGSDGGAAKLRIYVLDVGEGQAILLQQGERGVLVDTGSMVSVAKVVRAIREADVDHLDAIIVTHLHPDHATGIFRIREAYPDTPILHNGHPGVLRSGLDSIRWVAESLEDDPNASVFQRGDSLNFAYVTVRALWPESPLSDDLNQSSLVLSIENRDGDPYALLMGDAGIPVEKQLIANDSLNSQYPLLVAGHHGSQKTAGENFLANIRPEHVAVSINANNVRGYPDPDTLKRYEAAGATVWLTFRDGDICFTGFEQKQLQLCE